MTLTLNKPRIAVLATVDEYLRVLAATESHMHVMKAEDFYQLRTRVSEGNADGAVLSAAQLIAEGITVPVIADLVRAFPAIAFLGLVDEVPANRAAIAGHMLGAAGIPRLAVTRYPDGFDAVRAAFDSAGGEVFALRAVRELLTNCGYEPTPGWVKFLQTVFQGDCQTADDCGELLRMLPSTLMSRFFRAKLPSPKQYVTYARLALFASLAESPGLSVSAIANRMQCSSSQSLGRTIRVVTGLTAAEFRQKYNARDALYMFRVKLLDPYVKKLATFDPLAEPANAKRAQREVDRAAA